MEMLDAIFELSKKHGKYPPGAYVFVFEVLDFVGQSSAVKDRKSKHLTGKELALSAFVFSSHKYGLLAKAVWENLSLFSSEDLGQIVFHLVEEGLIGKQEEDRVEDFNGIYTIQDFDSVKIKITGGAGRWMNVVEKGMGLEAQFTPPEKFGLGEV